MSKTTKKSAELELARYKEAVKILTADVAKDCHCHHCKTIRKALAGLEVEQKTNK